MSVLNSGETRNISTMKALLFEGVPGSQNLNSDYDAFASGTNVYREEVIKALFRYGSYDAYFFLRRTPFLSEKQRSEVKARDGRAHVITSQELEQLNAYDDVVLFTPVPYINSLFPLRSTSSNWIANGVVHSLDGWHVPFLVLSLLHSDVDEADALFCSTHAGKNVVAKLFSALRRPESAISPEDVSPSGPNQPSLPVIPLGIDCQSYDHGYREDARRSFGLPADAIVVLYLGRISPISKCDLLPLFHVFAQIFRSHPEIRLIIAGDDTQHRMAEFLESAAEMLGCGSCISILPNIDDGEKIKLLTAADIFVSPSDNTQETFGLTIAEAMAAGLPVIASDWNGYRELIANGDTGFLIPTYWLPLNEDIDRLASTSFLFRNAMLAASTVVDPGALEQHLRLLIEQPDLRKTMGQLGRRHARQKYDWPIVISAYEDVWRNNLAKSRELRKGKSHFANCPPHYRYQQVFSHYPTHTLDYTEVVEIAAAGRSFLTAGSSAELTITPNGAIDLTYVRQLLQIALKRGPTSIAELAEHFTREAQATQLIALTTIAFSLKYNFLTRQLPFTEHQPS